MLTIVWGDPLVIVVSIMGGGVIVFSIIGMSAGLYVFFKSARLSSYLKMNNYERWNEFGAGFDSFRAMRYINSNIDNEDELILRLKDSIKKGIRFMAGFILLAFLTSLLLIVLALSLK